MKHQRLYNIETYRKSSYGDDAYWLKVSKRGMFDFTVKDPEVLKQTKKAYVISYLKRLNMNFSVDKAIYDSNVQQKLYRVKTCYLNDRDPYDNYIYYRYTDYLQLLRDHPDMMQCTAGIHMNRRDALVVDCDAVWNNSYQWIISKIIVTLRENGIFISEPIITINPKTQHYQLMWVMPFEDAYCDFSWEIDNSKYRSREKLSFLRVLRIFQLIFGGDLRFSGFNIKNPFCKKLNCITDFKLDFKYTSRKDIEAAADYFENNISHINEIFKYNPWTNAYYKGPKEDKKIPASLWSAGWRDFAYSKGWLRDIEFEKSIEERAHLLKEPSQESSQDSKPLFEIPVRKIKEEVADTSITTRNFSKIKVPQVLDEEPDYSSRNCYAYSQIKPWIFRYMRTHDHKAPSISETSKAFIDFEKETLDHNSKSYVEDLQKIEASVRGALTFCLSHYDKNYTTTIEIFNDESRQISKDIRQAGRNIKIIYFHFKDLEGLSCPEIVKNAPKELRLTLGTLYNIKNLDFQKAYDEFLAFKEKYRNYKSDLVQGYFEIFEEFFHEVKEIIRVATEIYDKIEFKLANPIETSYSRAYEKLYKTQNRWRQGIILPKFENPWYEWMRCA